MGKDLRAGKARLLIEAKEAEQPMKRGPYSKRTVA